MTQKCDNCRFYLRLQNGGGQCRRHAQQMVMWTDRDLEDRPIYTAMSDWPHMEDDQWCGDHEPGEPAND